MCRDWRELQAGRGHVPDANSGFLPCYAVATRRGRVLPAQHHMVCDHVEVTTVIQRHDTGAANYA
jgi:hypothetical protein